MPHLELTDEEAAALLRLVKRAVDMDRLLFIAPARPAREAILAKLDPQPVREPLSPPTAHAPPKATAAQRRRAGG